MLRTIRYKAASLATTEGGYAFFWDRGARDWELLEDLAEGVQQLWPAEIKEVCMVVTRLVEEQMRWEEVAGIFRAEFVGLRANETTQAEIVQPAFRIPSM